MHNSNVNQSELKCSQTLKPPSSCKDVQVLALQKTPSNNTSFNRPKSQSRLYCWTIHTLSSYGLEYICFVMLTYK